MMKRGFDHLVALSDTEPRQGRRKIDALTELSDTELEQRLRGLLVEGARTEANIIAHLVEVESRRLHLRAGYPSMFQYCLEHLGLSENEAFHRIVAARLAAAFPVIFELLEARKVHLSAVCLLRRHLTQDNHRQLLAEVCGKSKRQVEELLARRLPESVDAKARVQRFRPISEDCFRLELYVTKAQKEKLELARDLVSHANPSGDWGIVIERATDALTGKLQARRFGKVTEARSAPPDFYAKSAPRHSDEPRELALGGDSSTGVDGANDSKGAEARPPAASPTARSANGRRRHIPNPVRRLVAERDEMRCTFTSESGRRCGAQGLLQFDHRHAWARGGPETPDNLQILCAAHNRLRAEQEFGAATVKRGSERRQAKVATDRTPCPGKVPKSAA